METARRVGNQRGGKYFLGEFFSFAGCIIIAGYVKRVYAWDFIMVAEFWDLCVEFSPHTALVLHCEVYCIY